MLKLQTMRARLIAVITLISVVVCGVLATFFLTRQTQLIDLTLDREMRSDFASVLAAIDYERKTVLSLASFYGNLPEVRAALAADDRAQMVAAMRDAQKAIAEGFGYNLLTISRPPATVFVRVHNPASHSDDISSRRKMVVSVLQEGKTQSGIEQGASNLSIFGTVPIIHEGRRIGAADMGMEIGKPFVETVKARFGVDIAIHIQDGQGYNTLISTLPDKTVGGAADYQSGQQERPVLRRTVINGTPVAAYYGAIKNFSGVSIGAIEIVKNIQDIEAIATQTRTYAIIGTLVVLVLAVVVALFLGLGLSRPIVQITAAMQTLSAGQMNAAIPGIGRRDEIGAMANSVEVFKRSMIEAERLRHAQEETKRNAEVERKAAMTKLADAFEASIKGVVDAVSTMAGDMRGSAQTLSTTAEQTSRQSTAVAAASEEASTNVQTVAAASEELSSSISEISRQVTQSAKIAGQAVNEASETNQSVQSLAEAAQKIGEVVKLINDIAGQTNLLALNATIEAARAGEAGKGFAVVASEVKNLATQTARATEEITAQISAIQGATNNSVAAIGGIAKTIAEINEIATAIASAVEEQGAATQEIARNVQQAAKGTGEVSENIAGVTKAAGETGSAAALVLSAAEKLSGQSAELRRQVDSFLSQVRAA